MGRSADPPPALPPYHDPVDARPVAKSAAAQAPGIHPSSLAPTSLDRLLGRVQRSVPVLSQASDVLFVVVAGLLALVDVIVWLTDPVVDTGRLSVSLAVLVPCLGVVATIAVALRPKHLVGALVTVAGASMALTVVCVAIGTSLPPSLAALFALALLTTGVLRRQPGGLAVGLTAMAAVAVAAEALRPQVATAGYLLLVCEGAFLVAVGIGVYLRWSDWRRVAAADAARIDERIEIARELHDIVGHHLTAIVVQAQAARHVAERRPEAAAVALEPIERAGSEALVALRWMVGALRDDAPTAVGAEWSDIERLVEGPVGPGVEVSTSVAPAVSDLDVALAPSVHRIVAESLTNVRRHAHGATRVEIEVGTRGDRLVVTVHDDGTPGPAPGLDGFGIVGMRERAAALGGDLSAGPAPDGGWLVRAELPLEQAG